MTTDASAAFGTFSAESDAGRSRWSPANDRLVGSADADDLSGGAGSDIVTGRAGTDRLTGGRDADVLFGGRDGDRLGGGGGSDSLFGGSGEDLVAGGPGDDALSGGRGDDTIRGAEGDDWLRGESGMDRLAGGLGRDTLDGGRGDDRLSGGADADVFSFGDGAFGHDVIADFGSGRDRIVIVGASRADVTFETTARGLRIVVDGPGAEGSILLDGVDRVADRRLVFIEDPAQPPVVRSTADTGSATPTPDDPNLTLRDALALAARGIGADVDGDGRIEITFDPTVFDTPQTIVRNGALGQLTAAGDVAIIGPVDADGTPLLTLSGDVLRNDVTLSYEFGDRTLFFSDITESERLGLLSDNVEVFLVGPRADAAVQNLAIVGGVARSIAPDGGGLGVVGGASAQLSNLFVAGNFAETVGGGIAIYGANTVSLDGGFLIGNAAGSAGGAVGVTGPGATVSMSNLTFFRNGGVGDDLPEGGALALEFAQVTVVGSSFEGNEASLGGGIYIAAGGFLTGQDVTFDANRATAIDGGGAIFSEPGSSVLDLSGITFIDNQPNNVGVPDGSMI